MAGDWLTCDLEEDGDPPVGGAGPVAEVSDRGVLKAPVDWCCRRSKISCSSLGRRGGEGPGEKAKPERNEVLNARRGKCERLLGIMIVASYLDGLEGFLETAMFISKKSNPKIGIGSDVTVFPCRRRLSPHRKSFRATDPLKSELSCLAVSRLRLNSMDVTLEKRNQCISLGNDPIRFYHLSMSVSSAQRTTIDYTSLS